MDRQAKQIAYKAVRKGQKGALPAWHEFVALAQDAVKSYNAKPHSSLPWTEDERGRKVRQSPDQAWARAVQDGFQAVRCDDSLDELLPSLPRTTRRGEIELHGNRYYSRELAELTGETVRVAFDPWDAHKVWVRDMEGRFLAEAAIDGNQTPYYAEPFIKKSIEQRQLAADQRAAAKRDRRRDLPAAKPAVVAELTPEQRAGAARQMAEIGAHFAPAPLVVAAEPAPAPAPDRPAFLNRKDYVTRILTQPDAWPAEDVEEAQKMLNTDDDLRLWVGSDPTTAHLVAPPTAATAS